MQEGPLKNRTKLGGYCGIPR